MSSFEIVGGGRPSASEVAAISAALAVVLAPEPGPGSPNRWRWSGRPWAERWGGSGADWRDPGATAHPSFL